MVSLAQLWLPILVSAVFVFIVGAVLHMALPFWHNRDYRKFADDRPFLDNTRSLVSGMYLFPNCDWNKMTPEEKAEVSKGPIGVMYLRNPGTFSFGKTLAIHFVYCLVGSFLAAYVASVTVAPGAEYLQVHRVAGTVGIVFWAFGGNVADAIWYGKPWSVTLKYVIDGVIFGLLMGGTFGWLWP